MRIENLQSISLFDNQNKIEQKNETGFLDLFKTALQEVNQTEETADIIAEKFAIGEIENVHQVTIAAEQAELALNLTIAIRNKVVDAYKEIMRMQF